MPTSTFPCASPYRHFLSLTQRPPLPRAEVNNLKMFPAMKSQMGRSAVHKPCTTTWQIPMRQDCARPTNIALKTMSQERHRHLLPPKKDERTATSQGFPDSPPGVCTPEVIPQGDEMTEEEGRKFDYLASLSPLIFKTCRRARAQPDKFHPRHLAEPPTRT